MGRLARREIYVAESAKRPPIWLRKRGYAIVGGGLLCAALLGALAGSLFKLDLPDVRDLEDYEPPVMSHVYAGDGTLIASFAEEKRIELEHGEVPPYFRDALIASEDAKFWTHTGIDIYGGFRALWADLRARSMTQGASTLTMQLAGNLFLDRSQRTVQRKIQEALMALEIERLYSKEEILRFYTNQVYMGHGVYGLEAAARYYFGKPAAELTLGESAVIVGLLPRPSSYSPLINLERATRRRNLVLRRMIEEGYLTAAQAREAMESIVTVSTVRGVPEQAPYYVEEVRRWMQERYGSSGVYKEGLEVRTTMVSEMQAIAETTIAEGLREIDKRLGWREDAVVELDEGTDLATWQSPDWERPPRRGEITDGVVLAVDRKQAVVRVDERQGTLDAKAIAWTEVTRPDRLLAPGDVIRVRVVDWDESGAVTLELEQRPELEGALVALHPATGEVVAMVGGYDFERSEFNRATQAKRQTGSSFKPFVFAAAIEEGFTLADTLLDEPTIFLDRKRPDPYQPENFTRSYYETITMRTALEKSANIFTVKLMDRIGYEPVIDMARRLGISSDLRPFPSLALGAFEVTLLELTAAYGAFANQGVLVEPHLITEVLNREGFALHRSEPSVRDAVSPQVAYLMNRALEGVIDHGTGSSAAAIAPALAGKTGTTDDYADAWFIGYTPELAVGVWVGFDERRPIGPRESGSRAALPIWKRFMEQVVGEEPTEEFPIPDGIEFVSIDRVTGLKSNMTPMCDDDFSEAFIEGTEPADFCDSARRRQLLLPYPFHRFALDEGGRLRIPRNELERLLDQEHDVLVSLDESALNYLTAGASIRVPLAVLPPSAEPDLARFGSRYDVEGWKGTDGRRASIVWMD